jgi:hypothetical protein
VSNSLRFYLEPKPYPYLDKNAASTKWGRLTIVILSEESRTILLETEWDLHLLLEWFNQNVKFLKCETLINHELDICMFQSESLAQALNRLQERDFNIEEESLEEAWYKALFEFRQHHSLRFCLRGAAIPEIIIGLNGGVGEISLASESCEWSYKFDMDEFLEDIHARLLSFLN